MTTPEPTAGTALGGTTMIRAWQLTTKHVLVVDGRRIPLAATDPDYDSEGRHLVVARPADGGWAFRFRTYDKVTVADPVGAPGRCPACGGSGETFYGSNTVRCDDCRGTGEVDA